MRALVGTSNKEKALVGAFFVIVKTSRRFVVSSIKNSPFQYNDHELPSQLSPDQYFKLEWALSEDRQELDHPGGEGEPS